MITKSHLVAPHGPLPTPGEAWALQRTLTAAALRGQTVRVHRVEPAGYAYDDAAIRQARSVRAETLHAQLFATEQRAIAEALARHDGVKARAAADLGLQPTHLNRRLQKNTRRCYSTRVPRKESA